MRYLGTALKTLGLAVVVVALAAAATAAQQTALNYFAQCAGGAASCDNVLKIGGNLDVLSGGDLDLESGSTWRIAGTAVNTTAAELNNVADVSARLVAAGSALTVTAAHEGRLIRLDTLAGSTATLPDATGSGACYHFVVSVLATSNSHVVKVANATDIMAGTINITDTDTAGTVTSFATAADSDTITLNRSTTGSVTRGEWITACDAVADVWLVRGQLSNTGNGATPFSATVS